MVGRRPRRLWKFLLGFGIIVLLIVFVLVMVELLVPDLIPKVLGTRWEGLVEKEAELVEWEKSLEEKEKELEEKEASTTPSVKPWIVVMVVVGMGVFGVLVYFLFFKGLRKRAFGKGDKEMIKIVLKHLDEHHGLKYLPDNLDSSDIKSYQYRMFRPFSDTPEAWFVLQACFDSYVKGVDFPSHRCWSVIMSNHNPDTTVEDFPNRTLDEVMQVLFLRHYAKKEVGMPFLKSRAVEEFPGILSDVKMRAALEKMKETAKETYE